MTLSVLVGARCFEKTNGGETFAYFVSVMLLTPYRNATAGLLIVLYECSAI